MKSNNISSIPRSLTGKKNNYRTHAHCVFNLKYHLVLVTKYRNKCFTKEILQYLEIVTKELCDKWDVGLLEFGGEEDHIHLLLDMHPSLMISKFVGNLKTITSRYTRKKYVSHLSKYYWKPVLWSRAYCIISAGGSPLDVIKKYIENQGRGKEKLSIST